MTKIKQNDASVAPVERRVRQTIFIDSFSGNAADIKPKERTLAKLIWVLNKDPRISTFDFSEKPWLHRLVKEAMSQGLIKEIDDHYPWHRYIVIEA